MFLSPRWTQLGPRSSRRAGSAGTPAALMFRDETLVAFNPRLMFHGPARGSIAGEEPMTQGIEQDEEAPRPRSQALHDGQGHRPDRRRLRPLDRAPAGRAA